MSYANNLQKVGILTQPVIDNYGGILQAIALYETIRQLGFAPVLIKKEMYRPLWKKVAISMLLHTPGQDLRRFKAREKNRHLHQAFIDTHIPNQTMPAWTTEDLRSVALQERFSAVVVGSDQVWRKEYTDRIYFKNYFLDFLSGLDCSRVAYAASFGHSSWKYPDETDAVKHLLSAFDAVSVREESGVDICSALGRRDAVHVVDPTLLLGMRFYEQLSTPTTTAGKFIFCYVLDYTDELEAAIRAFREFIDTDVKIIRVNPTNGAPQRYSVPEWLGLLASSDYVLTDSFHGMLFSIIFNKRFSVVRNQSRGESRFDSLLNKLGLNDRVLDPAHKAEIYDQFCTPIDYAYVTDLLERWKSLSRSFLEKALFDGAQCSVI